MMSSWYVLLPVLVLPTVLSVSLRSAMSDDGHIDGFEASEEDLHGANLFVPMKWLSHAPALGRHSLKTISSMSKNPACVACNSFTPLSHLSTTAESVFRLFKEANYGNTCGINNKELCKPGGLPWKDVTTANVTTRVCEDAGTDQCCSGHDSARVWEYVNTPTGSPLFAIMECMPNKILLDCMKRVPRRTSTFCDADGHCEWDDRLAGCTECIFTSVPCLKATGNKWELQWPYGSKEKLDELATDGCMHGTCFGPDHVEVGAKDLILDQV